VQVFPGDATQPPGAAALDSPLPTPTASFSQTLLYTGYDGHYHIRAWPAGQTLLDDAMQPAMGPDGILAYRSTQAQRPGLFLLYPDASTRRITKGADDQWPRWGPGGQQLLFTSAQRSPDASPHLYLVDINTRRVEALGPGQHAHWARDGQIIFSGCQVGGRACGLWQLDTATLQRTPLTTIPDDSAPVQSPRGRYIAFMSSGRSNNWDLFLLDTQTNDLLPIAPHPAEDGLPAWSPDGKKIAFLSNRSGVWALYTWSLEDFSVTRRVAISAEIPNWQQAGLIWLP
jgi:Tol biopolymer transport system component